MIGLLISLSAGAEGQITQGNIKIGLEEVASGLTAPVFATHADDNSGRLFVVDQVGQVRVVDSGGALLSTPFLDLSSQLPALNNFFDERGLLGLAFHPDYENNGRFFVRYSMPRAGDPSEPCSDPGSFIAGCHSEVLSEFQVSSDPNVAAAAERVLFTIDEPQFNHNAGDVAFGPDGKLYFSLGDGGGAHDGLADVPPSHGLIGNGQNKETPLGAILRIDVDSPTQAPLEYAIPSDNPFANQTGADEIYAYGLRNPYRFSFDDGPGGSGDLILADVGQNRVEEINVITRGGNYGWVTKEGSSCFDPFNPRAAPTTCPDTGPDGESLLDPIAEYDHEVGGVVQGISVIGGYVYRGDQFPALEGKYVFGDFSTDFATPDGQLYYLDADGNHSQIRRFDLSGVPLGLFVKGFGEDEVGEIYLMSSTALAPTGFSGQVFRIVVPAPATGWMVLAAILACAAFRTRRHLIH